MKACSVFTGLLCSYWFPALTCICSRNIAISASFHFDKFSILLLFLYLHRSSVCLCLYLPLCLCYASVSVPSSVFSSVSSSVASLSPTSSSLVESVSSSLPAGLSTFFFSSFSAVCFGSVVAFSVSVPSSLKKIETATNLSSSVVVKNLLHSQWVHQTTLQIQENTFNISLNPQYLNPSFIFSIRKIHFGLDDNKIGLEEMAMHWGFYDIHTLVRLPQQYLQECQHHSCCWHGYIKHVSVAST